MKNQFVKSVPEISPRIQSWPLKKGKMDFLKSRVYCTTLSKVWLHIAKLKTVRARNLGVDSGHFFMRSDTHKMLELSHGVKP